MYEQFKNDVLMKLNDMSADILCKIASALDMVSTNYTITQTETTLVVVGREQFMEIAGAYLVAKRQKD